MAVAVTNSDMVLYDTAVLVTANPATSSVVDATEAFTITVTRPGAKSIIRILNPTAAEGSITYSIAAGSEWGAGAALTGTVANVTSKTIVLDTAKYVNDEDIVITLTPASGKRLLTDHVAGVDVVGTPF